MSFIQRNLPQTIDDLVFHNPKIAKTIREYATGNRTKHLLLYGPAGAGKSEAARILVDTLCPGTAGSFANEHINPKNFRNNGFDQIVNMWNAQMNLGGAPRGYIVIDEVDWFATKMMHELRGFMDDTKVGTIICTTNHLHVLDDPLKNRFMKLHVEWPAVEDWLPRAQSIMIAEGFDVTVDDMRMLLEGFQGSGRDLIEWLEEFALSLEKPIAPSIATPTLTANASPSNPTFTVLNGRAGKA